MSEGPLPQRVSATLRRWLLRLEPWAEKQWIGITLGALAIALLAGALIFVRMRAPSETPDGAQGTLPETPAAAQPAPAAAPVPAPGSAPGLAPPAAPHAAPAGAAAVDAGQPPSPNVKVVFRTFPSRRASVMWGGKRLGFIDRNRPLVVERPRDSGPLDVVIRAPGFVAVHARAYTFVDNTVDVKITPTDKKDTLFGFKAPLPPEPDAGAPP